MTPKIQIRFRSLWPALAAAGLAGMSVPADARDWTSSDGRTLEGDFVSADKDSVVIRKPDGSTVDIPVARLSDEDILHASRLAEAADAKAEAARKAEEEAQGKKKWLRGPLTYGLSAGSENWPSDRRRAIVKAMEEAIIFINRNAKFEKHVTANNSPGTPTADANYDGWINWGGSISRRVALHEIGHTLGIGTHPEWQANIKDGKWTGKHAVKQLKEFDGPDAVLHADRMHFWPYGLNFDNESNKEADLRFLKMVEAFRKDMGIR
jgi:hypothetical protein